MNSFRMYINDNNELETYINNELRHKEKIKSGKNYVTLQLYHGISKLIIKRENIFLRCLNFIRKRKLYRIFSDTNCI